MTAKNSSNTLHLISVVLPTPAHSRLPEVLSYRYSEPLSAGTMVRVPLGARQLLGVVWQRSAEAIEFADLAKLKDIAAVLPIAPLGSAWCKLVNFGASYYQRFAGELAMAALPPQLRELSDVQMERMLARREKKQKQTTQKPNEAPIAATQVPIYEVGGMPRQGQGGSFALDLSPEQTQALTLLGEPDKRPHLLFGATGSGKTEVYLRRIEQVLGSNPAAQALVMVPEINLTPQLEARFLDRIESRFGAGTVVLMHSGLTPAQRLQSWLSAHLGTARLVLGTRLAVLASLPQLKLIIVDEEHDPSYKSQDGSRYSARDLAVYRGQLEGAQVILGSATPSIESWQNTMQVSSTEPSRYRRLNMPSRVSSAAMPAVHVLDMRLQNKSLLVGDCLAPSLVDAIRERAARGEQSLLFLNRRGYAPVLVCSSCDWKSACPHCSANQVFHKGERRLRCHHCALSTPVPRQCPGCGNLDIGTQGRGTEQLEESITAALAGLRVLRIDADSSRGKGQLEAQLASVHAGEIDVLVGTQMVTKGHDFRRITLVAAVNPDSALFAADFRAPERLFALLMQAAGRAGRDAAVGGAQMWLQTHHPQHALYRALKDHDYPAYAEQILAERRGAAMPPFSFQALLRAEAKTQEIAQGFLDAAASSVQNEPEFEAWRDPQSAAYVTLYPAIPMPMQRIAGIERAQMLVEAASRAALQRMLTAWQPYLRDLKVPGVLRWALDVDPLAI